MGRFRARPGIDLRLARRLSRTVDEPVQDTEGEGFENPATGEILPEEANTGTALLAARAYDARPLGNASAEINLLARRFSGDALALKTLASLFHEAGDLFRSHRLYKRFRQARLRTTPHSRRTLIR